MKRQMFWLLAVLPVADSAFAEMGGGHMSGGMGGVGEKSIVTSKYLVFRKKIQHLSYMHPAWHIVALEEEFFGSSIFPICEETLEAVP